LTPDTVQFYAYKLLSDGVIALSRPVVNDYYVWVIKNNTLLTPSIDYKLNPDYQSITLAVQPSTNDAITLMTFSSNVLQQTGIAYMQFKDMLNRVSYKRLGTTKRTTLAQDLNWNDTEIVLTDASNFSTPSPSQNKPGVVEIRGERIEYFAMSGNTLSKLRRGTLGTGVYGLNKAGAYVQDIGPSETIPYLDTPITQTIVSDGTDIVNIEFVPTKESTAWTYQTGFTSSIPSNYGQADDIEVFVGGYQDSTTWASDVAYTVGTIVRIGAYTYQCIVNHTSSAIFNNDLSNWKFFIGNIRLKKAPYTVFNVNNGPYSPAGDVQFDADFAVDGTSSQIRLTNTLAIGTQITVIKQTGTAWDSSVNILNDSSKVATFIKAVPGIWYSEYKN
jgi:hypothetical protein